jgi:hypothetical protein
MKIRSLTAAFVAIGLLSGRSEAAAAAPPAPAALAQTKAAVDAAQAFLRSLGAEQASKVQFDFAPQAKASAASFKGGMNGRMNFVGEQYGQAVWSNYPVSDVPRPGLALGAMSQAQRQAAMRLLQAVLSPTGYEKVLDIMGSDQALSEGGTNYASGTAYYTIGIFGKPDASSPWMLQFGGHHLGLNVVIAGAQGTVTPTLTGAQPSVYQREGKTVRVLARENDKAFALLEALTPDQRKQAVLDYEVRDLVLGPGHDGEVIAPEGVKGSALDVRQRAMLLDLIGEWAGIVSAAYAGERMAALKAGLDDTYFAWSGPQTHAPGRNGSAYYRIQGPRLIIEFSPQGVGGDPTMHVHTVYRDPGDGYGRAFTAP